MGVFVSCVSHAFASDYCCLTVTCWERADLLALVGDVYCIFVTFQCGILGQVWYLILSFPDLCRFSYFYYMMLVFQNKNSHPSELLLSIVYGVTTVLPAKSYSDDTFCLQRY